MDKLLEEHRRVAVAVLEGLRATVYPSYQLKAISELPGLGESEIGWALSIHSDAGSDESNFEPYLVVKLSCDEQGNPVRFKCWDRQGRETATPRGDLSKPSLVKALKELHHQRPDLAQSIWRWLGRSRGSRRGKNRA